MSVSEQENRFRRLFHRPRRIRTSWEGDATASPIMIVRSIIFFGIICIASGGWCFTQATDPFLLEGKSLQFRLPGRLLEFTGFMLLAIGVVATTGSSRMLRVILIVISQSLCLAILLETIAASSAFAFYTMLTRGYLERIFLQQVRNDYGKEPRVTLSWNQLQTNFQCCGVHGSQDWNDSNWKKSRRTANMSFLLPASCCEGEGSCEAANATKIGCKQLATAALKHSMWSSCRCGMACVLLHVTLYLVVQFLERKM